MEYQNFSLSTYFPADLGLQPVSAGKTFEKTVNWYKNYYENGIVNTEDDLNSYIEDAKLKNISWTK